MTLYRFAAIFVIAAWILVFVLPASLGTLIIAIAATAFLLSRSSS